MLHKPDNIISYRQLVIEIDISPAAIQAAPPSSSGKTLLVGTTGGAVSVASPNGHAVSFAVNVMAKRSA